MRSSGQRRPLFLLSAAGPRSGFARFVQRDPVRGAVVELDRPGLSSPAMAWACVRVPPFSRWAVMPIARKVVSDA